MIKIAVDAMGGDYAPLEIVKGVELARNKYPEIEFQLYGKIDEVKPLIKNNTRIKLINADQIISMSDRPVHAVLTKRHSSLVMAAQAVKKGNADAFLSAGNSGAILAAGLFVIGRIKGIDRPAFTITMPTVQGQHHQFVILDVGANAESKAFNLYHFALMGKYYGQKILKFKQPRIGLLNNGTEYDKGDALHQKVYQLLKHNPDLNFIGNIEARELLNDAADVVVTDGFTGNAALKSIEGTALSMLHLIKHSILSGSLMGKLGALLLKPTFHHVGRVLDYSKYGGAVLMGVKAPVVKMHGNTRAKTVRNTIGQIKTLVDSQTVQQIKTYFQNHADEMETLKKQARQ